MVTLDQLEQRDLQELRVHRDLLEAVASLDPLEQLGHREISERRDQLGQQDHRDCRVPADPRDPLEVREMLDSLDHKEIKEQLARWVRRATRGQLAA
jgi:acetyl-CoA carboxylase carboxyltransferase component